MKLSFWEKVDTLEVISLSTNQSYDIEIDVIFEQ